MESLPRKNIFYLEGESRVGPVSLATFKAAFLSGRVNSSTLIWFPEIEDWSALSKLPELYESCVAQPSQGQQMTDENRSQKQTQPKSRIKNLYVVRHWNGELPLAMSFWINTCIPVLAFAFITFFWSEIVYFVSARYSRGGAWLVTTNLFLLFGLTVIWQVVGLWRSAVVAEDKSKYSAIAKSFLIFYLVAVTPTYFFFVTNIKEISLSDFELEHFEITTNEAILSIKGALEYGVADRFHSSLEKNPSVSLITLDSVGGIVSEAEKIAATIENQELSTVIIGECLSACTRIFAAGKNRIMLTNSNIGFHSPSYLFSNSLIDEFDIGQLYEHLTNKGFPSDLVDDIKATPNEKMWYAPTMPLRDSGFITNFATNLSAVKAILNGDTVVQEKWIHEEPTNPKNGVVSVKLGTEDILLPVPKGLLAIQSGEFGFDVFDSMTSKDNELLLVLVREIDYSNLGTEAEGFKIYARIQYFRSDEQLDRKGFVDLKANMIARYEELMAESEDKMHTALDRGSQRLSQTTEIDIQMQSVTMSSISIIEDSPDYLIMKIPLDVQMQVEGETEVFTKNMIQTITMFNGKLTFFNWYATSQPEPLTTEAIKHAKYFVRRTIQLNDSSTP